MKMRECALAPQPKGSLDGVVDNHLDRLDLQGFGVHLENSGNRVNEHTRGSSIETQMRLVLLNELRYVNAQDMYS
jgi:hypothetical protein